MANKLSSYRGQTYGVIPFGDKFRTSGPVSVANGVETTLLTVASGGGIIHGLIFDVFGRQKIDNIKVTIDGEAERTLTYGHFVTYEASGVGYAATPSLPLPIPFNESITIKINMTISMGSPKNVIVYYSVL